MVGSYVRAECRFTPLLKSLIREVRALRANTWRSWVDVAQYGSARLAHKFLADVPDSFLAAVSEPAQWRPLTRCRLTRVRL